MARVSLFSVDVHIARELRRAGHSPVRAEEDMDRESDLALISWDNPDSASWCQKVRTRREHVPLLALCSTGEQVEGALAAGVTDAFMMPVRTTLLLARVAHHVSAYKQFGQLLDLRTRELLDASRGLRVATEIAEAHDFMERLIDASPDPIMASDTQGSLLLFNRAAETLLGFSSNEARANLHMTDIYADPRDSLQVASAILGSPQKRVESFRTRLRARNGEQIPVVLSAAEVHDSEGSAIAMVGIFRDTRESDSLASRLRAATNQLIASEKRAATRQVAGATAHELNQPLTSVMGILELATMREGIGDEEKKRLEQAYEQLERMARIVRSLSEVTDNQTRSYVEGVEILDLESSKT